MPMERAMGHAIERANTFDAEKAMAAIGYLVQESGAQLYSVMKMLYLADKAHLGKFGRTITGDEYTAMKQGPVPERAYSLCKYVRGQRSHFDAMPNAREFLRLCENDFELLACPDMDVLSKSDVAALNEALQMYRNGGWRAVWRASHDAAWKAAWDNALARGIGSIDIDLDVIAASLPNAAALMEYLADPHPGDAELSLPRAAG